MIEASMKSVFSFLFVLLLSSIGGSVYAQCGDSIDLGTWILEGDTNNGNWVVTNGGNTVNQTINGDPTFYVSPDYADDLHREGYKIGESYSYLCSIELFSILI